MMPSGGDKKLVDIVLALYVVLEIAAIVYIAIWISRGYLWT